jgi:hypothetical protein
VPTLSNVDAPTAQVTIGAITYFTCDVGYESTDSTTNPHYTCMSNRSLVLGTPTCTRMQYI